MERETHLKDFGEDSRPESAHVSIPPAMSPAERARQFVEWALSHRDTPPLSDEAVARESMIRESIAGTRPIQIPAKSTLI